MKNTLRIKVKEPVLSDENRRNLELPSTGTNGSYTYNFFYCKILLIEDNLGDARLVEILLQDSDIIDCDIVNKKSLQAGIDMFREETFDAVLLDLSLPDSRGFVTLEKFMTEFPNANVIVLTGTKDKKIGIEAVKAGAQDYLVKGAFDSDWLAKALRYSIERSQFLNKLEEAQRVAKIAHWSYNLISKEFSAPDVLFRIIGYLPPGGCDPLIFKENVANLVGKSFFSGFADVVNKTVKNESYSGDFVFNHEHTDKRTSIFVQAQLSYNSKGEAVTVDGIIQDITYRKKREELEKDRDLAIKSAKIKEELLTRVSHEMRTPMNAILGMSNLLLKTELNEEQLGLVEGVEQNSVHLLGIINDILQISTIQNGKLKLEFKSFDLNALLSNLFNIVQYKLKEKNVQFELEIRDSVPKFVEADPNRLHQVLINLVGNSFKFTNEGVVKVLVQNIARVKDIVTLQFSVSDTGIGIPKDKLESIFEPFNRVENKQRTYEGTGLGLSIAHNIVTSLKGEMWVESELEKGSTFHFKIPVKEVQHSSLEKNVETYVPIDSTRTIELLLAEDNKFNQIVAKKTIEKEYDNINVTVVENGKDAVTIVEKQDFDIILMDLHMPIMDGYEATNSIRNMDAEKSKTPILAMTADAQIAQDEKFREYGMDDYVLKPFKPQQLFEKLAFYINKKTVYEH